MIPTSSKIGTMQYSSRQPTWRKWQETLHMLCSPQRQRVKSSQGLSGSWGITSLKGSRASRKRRISVIISSGIL